MKTKTMELFIDYMNNKKIVFQDDGGFIISLSTNQAYQLVNIEYGYRSKKIRHIRKHIKRLMNDLVKDALDEQN